MSAGRRAPSVAGGILRRLLPRPDGDDVVGELDREYEECVLPARGALAARLWYWQQAIGSIAWHLRRREGRIGATLDRLRLDTRFAIRSLWRSSGFTLLSVGTLALGIGASTAVFSVLNGVVLKPLPYPASHELVRLWSDRNISKAVNELIAEQAQGFESIHGHYVARETLTGHGEPTELYGVEVTPGYLSMLGAVPTLGRFILEGETVPGRGGVVVLAETTWRRLFGGDPDAVGTTIELGGETTTIVGIAPATFRPLIKGAEFWRPMTVNPDDFSDYEGVAQVKVTGRLSADAAADQASASVRAIASQLQSEAPSAFPPEWVDAAVPIPLHTALVSTNRATLWTVMGAAAFLLLTACANVANLLLARSSQRHREIAIRIGLGASTGRIARQLLTESVLLGAMGGALGVALAWILLRSSGAALPPGLPLADSVQLDNRVMLFGLATTLLTSLLFGIGPALRAARIDPQRYLRDATPSVSRGREGSRMNRILVGAEIALAVVLAIGAGLMLRSLQQLSAVDTGISTAGVTTMRVRLPANSLYAGEPERAAMFGSLTARLDAVVGVESVGAATFLPMESGLATAVYRADGVEYPEDQPPPNAAFQIVLGDYFGSLGIPLLAGRTLGPDDTADSPVVGVINQSLAEDAFGGVPEALGERITMFGGVDFEVVGVVANSLQLGPSQSAWAEAFFSYRQASWWPSMYLIVRGAPDAPPTADSLRAALWEIDPQVPVLDIRPMAEVVQGASAQPRYLTLLLSGFGVLALLLGAIGVYGLMSFAVTERIYEFGIRAALGASRARILRQAVGDALGPALAGVAVGCGLAAAMTSSMRGMLFGIAEHDPLTFGLAPLVLFAVAMAASYLPARRAAAVDPKRLMSPD